jgi:hypothetical protein
MPVWLTWLSLAVSVPIVGGILASLSALERLLRSARMELAAAGYPTLIFRTPDTEAISSSGSRPLAVK